MAYTETSRVSAEDHDGNASQAMTTYDGSSHTSARQGMNTSGRSRGSAWWARWSRASSESIVTGPSERGFQCRIATWMHHSITGNSATSAAGTTSSHRAPPPTTTLATIAPSRDAEISHGLGSFQNSAHAARIDNDSRRFT